MRYGVLGEATARPVVAAAKASTDSPFVVAVADEIRLLEAWQHVRSSGGSRGPDGVTVEQFQQSFGSRLARLRSDLLSGTYRPGPITRIFIPKDDGSFRSIGLAGLGDRIVQASAASWLQEKLDTSFHEASYGYRPGLGPRRAALRAWKLSLSASHAVNADIEKFFDNVDHRILKRLLEGIGIDETGTTLITAWLTATPRDRGQSLHSVKGLPQGSPVSPILANLYLHDFDMTITRAGYEHVRFADDFIVFSKNEAEVRGAFELVRRYLERERGLSLKAAKTHVVPMTEGFRFVGFEFTVAGPSLPASTTDRLKTELSTRLDEPGQTFAESVRSVNDAVRGWNSYYGGFAHRVDEAWPRSIGGVANVARHSFRSERTTLPWSMYCSNASAASALETRCQDPTHSRPNQARRRPPQPLCQEPPFGVSLAVLEPKASVHERLHKRRFLSCPGQATCSSQRTVRS